MTKILVPSVRAGFAVLAMSAAGGSLASIARCPDGFAHADEVRRVEFAAGEKWLLSADRRTLKVWSLANGSVVGNAILPEGINAFRASPIDPLAAVLTGKYSVELRSLPDLKVVRSWEALDYAEALAFSPDGKIIATGAWGGMRLWSTASGELVKHVASKEGFSALSFSADGNWLASAGNRDLARPGPPMISIWRLSDYGKVREITTPYREGAIFTVAFTQDGKQIAAGSNNDQISLWKVDDGGAAFVKPGHPRGLWTVTVGADGETLLSADRGRVRVWKLADGSVTSTWDAHEDQINSIASSLRGPMLVTAGRDRSIRLWNASEQTLQKCLVDAQRVVKDEAPKSAAKPRRESRDVARSTVPGSRILDDVAFFSPDFAKKVRAAVPGKGQLVPSPAPEIAKLEKKYGKAPTIDLKLLSVENGPTLLMAIHYYGDIGFGVANDRVMAVLKK